MEGDGDIPSPPICSVQLGPHGATNQSNRFLKKVDEIQECIEIYCEGFENQFNALLIVIEAGQPPLARSYTKKDRKLKRLVCSVNYDSQEGSGRSKFRAFASDL